MTILQAALLGALQGITEFLPVSSSGHLVVFRSILGIGSIPVLFDVLLHVSTLFVVCFVFRRRIGCILTGLIHFFRHCSDEEDRANQRLFIILVLASAVTAVLGLFISSLDAGRYPRLVSVLFIVTGGILVLSRFARGDREYGALRFRDGLITGLAQGLGVFPGISRSGIVISAALFTGMKREQAGEFAFLLSIPAIVGAFLLELPDAGALAAEVSIGALAAGMIASLLVGFASLKVLLILLKRAKFHFFAFYLIPLGIAGLILL